MEDFWSQVSVVLNITKSIIHPSTITVLIASNLRLAHRIVFSGPLCQSSEPSVLLDLSCSKSRTRPTLALIPQRSPRSSSLSKPQTWGSDTVNVPERSSLVLCWQPSITCLNSWLVMSPEVSMAWWNRASPHWIFSLSSPTLLSFILPHSIHVISLLCVCSSGATVPLMFDETKGRHEERLSIWNPGDGHSCTGALHTLGTRSCRGSRTSLTPFFFEMGFSFLPYFLS